VNVAVENAWPHAVSWQRGSFVVGGAGGMACVIGAMLDVESFLQAYLFGYLCVLGVALGSLGIWMIHNLTGGRWGLLIRRILEAATRTLPLLAILFVPIALGMPEIYRWVEGGAAQPDYLNVPFFLVRSGIYFALWIILAALLNRWSAPPDETASQPRGESFSPAGDPRGSQSLAPRLDWAEPQFDRRAERLSGPGLVVLGLSVTFAAIDWVMSLEAPWPSTIFGALVATGQLLPAMGFAIAMATWLAPRAGHAELAVADVWNDLGNLLLAFVMLWTYMAFSQWLLIWSGNLPEEIVWYVKRAAGGWEWPAVALAAFYFALPFVLLLSRDIKRDPARLRVVAIAVVVMSVVDQYWLIAPAFAPQRFTVHWLDVAALVAIGGVWFGFFMYQLLARPLTPRHDPAPAEVLRHA
jgi:hypothetical protein